MNIIITTSRKKNLLRAKAIQAQILAHNEAQNERSRRAKLPHK